jgi:peptidyl-tRNA hydrolase
MGMQNPGNVGSSVEGWGEGLNESFKVVQQVKADNQHSIKNLAPAAKKVREMGANFDMGSKIGMTKINTAESTKIQAGPEVGKGSLVDEVF